MKIIIAVTTFILIVLLSCINSGNNKLTIIENSDFLFINDDEDRECISLFDRLENIQGRKFIYLIDSECPMCLIPFLRSLDSIEYSNKDFFVFSVCQNYDYMCDLISEIINDDIPYYIDKRKHLYNEIMSSGEIVNGLIKVSEDISIVPNPRIYKDYK